MMRVSLPTVDECCCGCSLKTGVLIIGTIRLIFYILPTVAFAALFGLIVTSGQEIRIDISGYHAITGVVAGLVGVLVSSLLIHGARKDRPSFLVIWMVHTVISFIMGILYMAFFWKNAIVFIMPLFLDLYFLIVVSSFRKQLKDKEKSPPAYTV